MRQTNNTVLLLASYQEGRSRCLKTSKTSTVGLEDYFCNGELEDYLYRRRISRHVSHYNFAIESLGGVYGTDLDERLLSALTTKEKQIIQLRVVDKLTFSEIAIITGQSVAQIAETVKKSQKKITTSIRASSTQ